MNNMDLLGAILHLQQNKAQQNHMQFSWNKLYIQQYCFEKGILVNEPYMLHHDFWWGQVIAWNIFLMSWEMS